jgi:hypothetical protein
MFSTLMRNRAGNFSVGRLMEFLTALGQNVRITVKPTRKARGEMAVVMGKISLAATAGKLVHE